MPDSEPGARGSPSGIRHPGTARGLAVPGAIRLFHNFVQGLSCGS